MTGSFISSHLYVVVLEPSKVASLVSVAVVVVAASARDVRRYFIFICRCRLGQY